MDSRWLLQLLEMASTGLVTNLKYEPPTGPLAGSMKKLSVKWSLALAVSHLFPQPLVTLLSEKLPQQRALGRRAMS
jgi:hypothetical protein